MDEQDKTTIRNMEKELFFMWNVLHKLYDEVEIIHDDHWVDNGFALAGVQAYKNGKKSFVCYGFPTSAIIGYE